MQEKIGKFYQSIHQWGWKDTRERVVWELMQRLFTFYGKYSLRLLLSLKLELLCEARHKKHLFPFCLYVTIQEVPCYNQWGCIITAFLWTQSTFSIFSTSQEFFYGEWKGPEATGRTCKQTFVLETMLGLDFTALGTACFIKYVPVLLGLALKRQFLPLVCTTHL